jgi:hypothetical protein
VDSTSSSASCDRAFSFVFVAPLSLMGEDGGTSTLPICCSAEAKIGDFAGSVMIAVASDSGDAGPGIFVPDRDCGAVASTLLSVCEELG